MRYKLSKTLFSFFEKEKVSGLLLIGATAFSLFISNSFLGNSYKDFWLASFHVSAIEFNLTEIINEFLMAVFFLFAGLEIKREIINGELSSFKKASLPVAIAIGGMIVPAVLYAILNFGHDTISGWGIPMATDIAFALGFLLLGGKKVSSSLRIILVSLAVVDDIGAIIVIALFYTHKINLIYILLTGICFSLLLFLNKKKVNNLLIYILFGGLLWYFVLQSGIHSTISGVLLAFSIPMQIQNKPSLLLTLINKLHNPVYFIILPLFALANSCIAFKFNTFESLLHPISLGIIIGLFIGKPLGICTAIWLSIKIKISEMPSKVSWKSLIGMGFLGGVGFTMSIFVSILAFGRNEIYVDTAKAAIILASLISGITGVLLLRISNR